VHLLNIPVVMAVVVAALIDVETVVAAVMMIMVAEIHKIN